MNTQTQEATKIDTDEKSKSSTSGVTVTGYAVLGCLVAGTVALFKAARSDGIGAAACILAAVAAFGTICYIYFRKD